MVCNKWLSASLEDYLEAIYNIIAKKTAARSRDIAARLGVSGSSVTEALRNLSARKLIHYAPYEMITLTPKGRKLAEDLVHRHRILCYFFTNILCVERNEAENTACRMEHSVSQPVLEKLTRFIEYMDRHPAAKKEWIEESSMDEP